MKKIHAPFYALSGMIVLTLLAAGACSKAKTPPPLPEVFCNGTISFSTQIAPMIEENCSGCHGAGAGTSPVLSNHAEISQNADQIIHALRGTPQLMPEGGPALADSLIQQFQCWLQQGTLNN
ncbi:c-type cytochrome [Fluviicola chungangensis]|uniref:Cytochrome c n=1 Tax=Fluviicola chungangensis TaxID=2597671 RepID=A0A556MYK5_9FLAO|nr:cytochrome c [Fluviicola chungangensis]TSJ45000.1 cytochrome c [Fluviicola chungangensis]